MSIAITVFWQRKWLLQHCNSNKCARSYFVTFERKNSICVYIVSRQVLEVGMEKEKKVWGGDIMRFRGCVQYESIQLGLSHLVLDALRGDKKA